VLFIFSLAVGVVSRVLIQKCGKYRTRQLHLVQIGGQTVPVQFVGSADPARQAFQVFAFSLQRARFLGIQFAENAADAFILVEFEFSDRLVFLFSDFNLNLGKFTE
jgi:hypothetical protein